MDVMKVVCQLGTGFWEKFFMKIGNEMNSLDSDIPILTAWTGMNSENSENNSPKAFDFQYFLILLRTQILISSLWFKEWR